jgi:sugar phosphate isomerase/epimerase
VRLALSGTEVPPANGVETFIAAARRLGVNCVEFWYPQNSERLGLRKSIDRLSQARISVACVATATELGTDGDVSAPQQTIIEAVHIAADIGCHQVNTYFGWPSILDDKRSIEIYRRNLQPCLRVAEAAKVVLVLENEFDGFGCDPLGTDLTRRPNSVMHLMAAVDSPFFRLTFDPCNAYFAGLDPHETYETLAPYIAYVHLKDGKAVSNDAQTPDGWRRFADHGQCYVTCPLGDGDVGWPQLFRHLNRDGYDGYFATEPHCEARHLMAGWEQAVGFLQRSWNADATSRSGGAT